MAIEDESEFLLDEYHSDEESENVAARKDTVGRTNISPEVLKMLQQMTPAAPVEKEEDEPDEIKVSHPLDRRFIIDILRIANSFSAIPIRRRTRSSRIPSNLPIATTINQPLRTRKTHPSRLTKATLHQPLRLQTLVSNCS